MKNFFFLAAVALGAAVCSCSTDILDQPEFNGSEMMVEASGFDSKDAASYISWIKISRQGTGELTYRTELKYAEGCDTLLPAIEAPSVKHVCDLRPTEGKMLREKTDGPLIIRSYQTEYTVCYADFEVPVLFTTEKAFFSDHDGEYVLPVPEVRYALQEPKLTELADETADGKGGYIRMFADKGSIPYYARRDGSGYVSSGFGLIRYKSKFGFQTTRPNAEAPSVICIDRSRD